MSCVDADVLFSSAPSNTTNTLLQQHKHTTHHQAQPTPKRSQSHSSKHQHRFLKQSPTTHSNFKPITTHQNNMTFIATPTMATISSSASRRTSQQSTASSATTSNTSSRAVSPNGARSTTSSQQTRRYQDLSLKKRFAVTMGMAF